MDVPRASRRRPVSADYPRGSRGGAATPSPETIHVAAAGAPRLVSEDYSRRCRSVSPRPGLRETPRDPPAGGDAIPRLEAGSLRAAWYGHVPDPVVVVAPAAGPADEPRGGGAAIPTDKVPAQATTPRDDPERGFEPCDAYEGSRRGKVFKLGYFGLGYYVDALEKRRLDAECAAAAALESYEASAKYDGRRPGRVFTTREPGTGYYVDNPPYVDPSAFDPSKRGALVLRGHELPPANGMVFSKAEFDTLRLSVGADTVLCLFFEKCADDGGGSAKVAPAFKKMAQRFWPKAVLLRCDVDAAKDLVKACGVSTAPSFVWFKAGKPIDKMTGTCEMTLNVKIVKALKHGNRGKRREKWGEGFLKQK